MLADSATFGETRNGTAEACCTDTTATTAVDAGNRSQLATVTACC